MSAYVADADKLSGKMTRLFCMDVKGDTQYGAKSARSAQMSCWVDIVSRNVLDIKNENDIIILKRWRKPNVIGY